MKEGKEHIFGGKFFRQKEVRRVTYFLLALEGKMLVHVIYFLSDFYQWSSPTFMHPSNHTVMLGVNHC